MGFKSLSIVLFGLALCCFLQGTAAQDDICVLKFWADPSVPTLYEFRQQGEGNFTEPYEGWYTIGKTNFTNSLPMVKAVEKASAYCDYCVMTAYKGIAFNGTSKVIDFRTRVGDNSQVSWDFYADSYTLKCYPPEPQEEEYYEEWEPQEEEIEYEEMEEEEEELEEDISGEYLGAVFKQMNEGDGSTLPHQLVELRHKAVDKAVDRLIIKDLLEGASYIPEKVFATEYSTNYEGVYRFNVQVRNLFGVEFRIWFTTISYTDDHQAYQLIDAGLKENRLGEFPTTDFKVLPPVEESQQPYPAEVEDLGSKSVKQALVRLQQKGVLPQATYTSFNGYNSIEYSDIVNMTEYPDQEDMLYRFNLRVVDQSGIIYRIWVIIATNYETPEYYELIDYGYKQSRLSEFTLNEWRPMNEGEDMPLPGEVVQMRNRSVAQAIPRLIAEGALPAGKYSIANTYATEFTGGFENPDYPYLMGTPDDMLYRFNVQLSNEAGARFRVAVVAVTNFMIQPQYELIDYFFVENRLDEFNDVKFVSLDEGDLQTKSINQAVDRLIAKSVLPGGKYTIAKTFPVQFSPKFENADYSDDEYVLYKFTAQVNNAAGTGFKVYAIVISKYDDSSDFDLIDYGKVTA